MGNHSPRINCIAAPFDQHTLTRRGQGERLNRRDQSILREMRAVVTSLLCDRGDYPNHAKCNEYDTEGNRAPGKTAIGCRQNLFPDTVHSTSPGAL